MIFGFVVFALFLNTAYSKDMPSSNNNNVEFSDDAKRLLSLHNKLTNKGGKGVKAISFKESKLQFALTILHDGKREKPPMHLAKVSASSKGADISFKVYHNCTLTGRDDNLIRRVIRIDDKNVSALSGCGKEQGKDNTMVEVFLIKSRAGKEYARKKFLENEYVFVDFGSGLIPFSTEGFESAWNRADQPAL
jgi:hypothetical protein